MKIYKVKVNGKVYEVELESITESNQKVIETPKAEPAKPVVADATGRAEIKAPMQGVILDIKANVGDTVKKGQTVFILEAMKLENEIVSPADGVIKQILVHKDQGVDYQQLLAVID